MKGDFTRLTFHPANHYSSLRSQQGRVQVDANWNEAVDILAHWDRNTRRDVIGLCGGPQGQDSAGDALAGFLIDAVSGDLQIAKGRYYVDGLLVENENDVAMTAQPDLPDLPGNTLQDVLTPPGGALAPGTYLAYLDVWERHITALEDPNIREVALGGPDTATRTKVVWQVRLMAAQAQGNAPLNCASELPLWNQITAPSTGQLSARAEPGDPETDPCEVPAGALYRGLENQLYRVEVHRVDSANKITVKWSRENGSVVFGWIAQDDLDPNKLTLSSAGRDDVLGVNTNDWVELTDDKRELRGQPGLLVKVVNVEGAILTVDPGSEIVDRNAFPVNPKVRRWDMPRDVGEITVDLTLSDNWIALENGVEVKLEPGTYRTGDYWMIPARTATRNIEWPQDDTDNPLPQSPLGIRHHYCRLAMLHFDGTAWERLSDCRNLFPPLTGMVRFFHISGDGQEAMPGRPVPKPLQVGVLNGERPVAGARVRFEVTDGSGLLRAAEESPCSDFTTGGAASVEVETGPDGVAGCCYRLDAGTLSQQVEATLLEIDGKPLVDDDDTPLLTPIRFNANLSVAAQVAYDPQNCPDLSTAETVQEAIDLLCKRSDVDCCITVGSKGDYESLDEAIQALLKEGQRDICLCLLPGNHAFPGLDLTIPVEEPDLHLKISGCGLGTRVSLEKPLRLTGVKAITLRDVAIESGFIAEGKTGAIALDHCSEVTLTGCHVTGFTAESDGEARGVLLSIASADRVHLHDNLIEAASPRSFAPTRGLFKQAEVDFLIELFSPPDQGIPGSEKFRAAALEAAQKLAGLDAETRKKIHEALQAASGDDQFLRVLSAGEFSAIGELNAALLAEAPQPSDLLRDLIDIRRAAIKSRPGVAVVLSSDAKGQLPQDTAPINLEGDACTVLESNELIGILGLYGLPISSNFVVEIFDEAFLKQLEDRVKQQQIILKGPLGTLQIRGNQLVRISVVPDLVKQLQNPGDQTVLFNLFENCLMSDNVIEGGASLLLTRHLAMTADAFTLATLPNRFSAMAAVVVADSSIYVGNHGRQRDAGLRIDDVSRVTSQAANLEINIV